MEKKILDKFVTVFANMLNVSKDNDSTETKKVEDLVMKFLFHYFKQTEATTNENTILIDSISETECNDLCKELAELGNAKKDLILQIDPLRDTDLGSQKILTLLSFEIEKIDLGKYSQDYLSIAALLQNQNACDEILDKLEMALQEYAKGRDVKLVTYRKGENGLPDLFQLPDIEETDGVKKSMKQKILSSYLFSWAKENGFNSQQFAKVNNILNKGEFFSLLQFKTLFKDKGVNTSPDHSTWPHFLQQYIIAEYNKDHVGFLQYQPAELYQAISILDQSSRSAPIWNYLYDLLQEEAPKDSYKSPENLTSRLLQDAEKLVNNDQNDQARYPLLSGSVARQCEIDDKKQSEKRKDRDSIILVDYTDIQEPPKLKK